MELSQREYHQTLELRHNMAALGTDELREDMDRTDVGFWQRSQHWRECAVLASWAQEHETEGSSRQKQFESIRSTLIQRLSKQSMKELFVVFAQKNSNGALYRHDNRKQQFIEMADRHFA